MIFTKLIFLFISLKYITVESSSGSVNLTSLKGVPRLDSDDYYDYYFSCNAIGFFLQWQYNGELLTAFQTTNEIGRSVVIERPSFIYTTTLLSSEPAENNYKDMDSILIVSFSNGVPPSFTVTCSNGPNSKTVDSESASRVEDSSMRNNNTDTQIVLEYIVSTHLPRIGLTHIFMCGANHSPQLLQANGPPIAFLSSDQIGFHRAPSATTYTVKEQGIFVARSPYMTTTVLIVANEEDVSVSCFYDDVYQRLQSTYNQISTTTNRISTTTQEAGTSTPSTTVTTGVSSHSIATTSGPGNMPSETMDLEPISPQAGAKTIPAYTIVAVVVAIGVVVIISSVLVILILIKKKWKVKSNYPVKDTEAAVCGTPPLNENTVEFSLCRKNSNDSSCSSSGISNGDSNSVSPVSSTSTVETSDTAVEDNNSATSDQSDSAFSEDSGSTDSLQSVQVKHDMGNDTDNTKDTDSRLLGLRKRTVWSLIPGTKAFFSDQEEDTVKESKEVELQPKLQVQEGGAQFAALTAGTTQKPVYVNQDGVTFEHPCKPETPRLNFFEIAMRGFVHMHSWLIASINSIVKALVFQLDEHMTNSLPQLQTSELTPKREPEADARASRPISAQDVDGISCVLTPHKVIKRVDYRPLTNAVCP